MTGSNNIVVGMNSLTSITSGSKNVALGSNVLNEQILGNGNVGVGFDAGAYAASQCSGCTFLGYTASPVNTDTSDYLYLTLLGGGSQPVIQGMNYQLVLGSQYTTTICPPASQFCIPYATSLSDLPTSTATPPGSFLFVQNTVDGDVSNMLMINTTLTVGDAPVWYGVLLSPST